MPVSQLKTSKVPKFNGYKHRNPWRTLRGGCEQGARRADAGPGSHLQGEPVQVDPMKPVLKAPGYVILKLEYDGLLSSFGLISTCAATPRRCGAASTAPPWPPPFPHGASCGWAQGLTLVHFSAQRKHFVWDRGSM